MAKLEERYLTAKQLAALLHVKERKIYELASSGEIPSTRALGKWLFERAAIEQWLQRHASDTETHPSVKPPNVFLGSHDQLLEWSLRESNSGLATFLDGSLDGLERFADQEGVATGLHIFDPTDRGWNVAAVKERLADKPVVLVEWGWRNRGLIVQPGNPGKISKIADLAGKRVVPRQASSGTQKLFEHYLEAAGLSEDRMELLKPARTELDAGLAVLEATADAAFGLESVAAQFRLDFVPVVRERFDILVWRREWFQPPFQKLMKFFGSDEFRQRAKAMAGYDFSQLGTVHFNGP